MMTAGEARVLMEIRDLLQKLVTRLVDEPREYEKAVAEVNRNVTDAMKKLSNWAQEKS